MVHKTWSLGSITCWSGSVGGSDFLSMCFSKMIGCSYRIQRSYFPGRGCRSYHWSANR